MSDRTISSKKKRGIRDRGTLREGPACTLDPNRRQTKKVV